MEELMFRMEWRQVTRVDKDEEREPDEFVYGASGKIIGTDDEDQDFVVGGFEIAFVDINRALRADVHPFDVMDGHSDRMAEIYSALFNNVELKRKVRELLGIAEWGSNLLVLDRIELEPTYRGKGIGPQVIETLIDRFSPGAVAVALKPFPLQFEATRENRGARPKKGERTATKKLRAYYERLGFRRIGKANVMARALESW